MTATEITTILVAIARLEGKVDALAAQNLDGEKVHDDHEQRLRRLERWMFLLTGAAATLGSSAGVIVSKLLGG